MITINELVKRVNGTFFVKVCPDDSVRQFNSEWDNLAEMIIDGFSLKYKDKVIGFETQGNDYNYIPVFDTETQREWNTELHNYISRKAEWCRKYGSN